MINVIYGKAIENLRNRINVKLVNNKKDYLKRTSKLYVTTLIYSQCVKASLH